MKPVSRQTLLKKLGGSREAKTRKRRRESATTAGDEPVVLPPPLPTEDWGEWIDLTGET
jgi:hypothetical protein